MGRTGGPRALLLTFVGLWFGITLLGSIVATVQLSFGDLDCLATGSDSNYGRKEWSVAPPGPRCVWTRDVNGFAAEDEPSELWSLWLVAVILSGLGAAVLGALTAQAPPRTGSESPGPS